MLISIKSFFEDNNYDDKEIKVVKNDEIIYEGTYMKASSYVKNQIIFNKRWDLLNYRWVFLCV